MARILDGRVVAKALQQQIKQYLESTSSPLVMGILQVGANPASNAYIQRKKSLASKLGIGIEHVQLAESCTTDDLIARIQEWNADEQITGYIIQLPLPEHINQQQLFQTIQPQKDADGLSPYNIGHLLSRPYSIIPATTRGILNLLDYYNLDVKGRQTLVIGRSHLVGKPTALCLMQLGATVTLAHSRTPNLDQLARNAEVLVVAIGQPLMIDANYVNSRTIAIDVGITRTDNGLVGDIDFAQVEPTVAAITPVPGGIGPLTVASLFQNLAQLHQHQHANQ